MLNSSFWNKAALVGGGVLVGGASGLWFDQYCHDVKELEAKPKYPNLTAVSLEECVGNTPLLEIKSLSQLTGCTIYAKAEYLNPSGSVKDRAAKYLIEYGEREGLLTPAGVIVEATGGNTGPGLALLANAKGYRCIFTMPDFIAQEKINLMKTLGAEVYVQPSVGYEDEQYYYKKAIALSKEIPNAYFPDQFENTANMMAHYETTGPEIMRQTDGKIDGFVCASGTAGTIAGVTKYLKETKPEVVTYLIDPSGGAMSGYIESDKTNGTWIEGKEFVPRKEGHTIAEGIGLNRVTNNFREAQVDGTFLGTDEELIKMAFFLLRNDGIFVGPSAALNVVGAVKLARKLGKGHTIVTILCDGGDRYRSKLYNAEWLKANTSQDLTAVETSIDFVK